MEYFILMKYCTACISPYSVRMRENTDQKKAKYGHFSRSIGLFFMMKNQTSITTFTEQKLPGK